MLRPSFLALLVLLAGPPLLLACAEERGDSSFGEPCGADGECADGLCVGGVDGDEPVCTRSCARAEDCPEGWSCSGVTARQVVVCKKGGATPFGR